MDEAAGQYVHCVIDALEAAIREEGWHNDHCPVYAFGLPWIGRHRRGTGARVGAIQPLGTQQGDRPVPQAGLRSPGPGLIEADEEIVTDISRNYAGREPVRWCVAVRVGALWAYASSCATETI